MLLTGAEILVECLLEQGVDTVFGYPGGTALCVYDALYKYSDKLRHILTAHEQGAAHAADGYARSTGHVGVCLVTSGPGATNLVTGIATAYMDSSPVVAITINVSTSSLGKDSFQEVDIAGITMPVTKHNFIVKDIDSLADTLRRAFRIASSGRKGPVLVDITKDVTQCKTQFEHEAVQLQSTAMVPEDSDISNMVKLMKKAQKPVLLVGGGALASGASQQIKELTQKYCMPVVETLMGKSAYSCENSDYFGMVGIHGTVAGNFALSNADLIISLGCRFSERVTANPSNFAKAAKLIQVDIDAAELDKNIIPTLAVNGDIKETLIKLNSKFKGKTEHDKWLCELDGIKKESLYVESGNDILTGPDIVRSISKCAPDATIVTEVGQHQMWAAQYYDFKNPHTLITSGGLGTMGFGLGAAIGVQLGSPNKTVINIAGDGCLRMNMNELATVSAYKLPIIEIVINNQSLGMVRQWQKMFYGERYSQTQLADVVDYVKLAAAMGISGVSVKSKQELEAALKRALDERKPMLIECVISEDESVFPMVIPGSSLERTYTREEYYAET